MDLLRHARCRRPRLLHNRATAGGRVSVPPRWFAKRFVYAEPGSARNSPASFGPMPSSSCLKNIYA
jgi:hypothetical protein